MSKSFIAVFLLILLIPACSRPINITTLPEPDRENLFAQPMASATATALPDVTISPGTPTPLVVTATEKVTCDAPAARTAIGDEVLVTVENWDKLKLRSKPEISSNNVVMELEQYSRLKILDGPICASSTETSYSYWFWKAAVIPSNEMGWIAEGDYSHYFIQKY